MEGSDTSEEFGVTSHIQDEEFVEEEDSYFKAGISRATSSASCESLINIHLNEAHDSLQRMAARVIQQNNQGAVSLLKNNMTLVEVAPEELQEENIEGEGVVTHSAASVTSSNTMPVFTAHSQLKDSRSVRFVPSKHHMIDLDYEGPQEVDTVICPLPSNITASTEYPVPKFLFVNKTATETAPGSSLLITSSTQMPLPTLSTAPKVNQQMYMQNVNKTATETAACSSLLMTSTNQMPLPTLSTAPKINQQMYMQTVNKTGTETAAGSSLLMTSKQINQMPLPSFSNAFSNAPKAKVNQQMYIQNVNKTATETEAASSLLMTSNQINQMHLPTLSTAPKVNQQMYIQNANTVKNMGPNIGSHGIAPQGTVGLWRLTTANGNATQASQGTGGGQKPTTFLLLPPQPQVQAISNPAKTGFRQPKSSIVTSNTITPNQSPQGKLTLNQSPVSQSQTQRPILTFHLNKNPTVGKEDAAGLKYTIKMESPIKSPLLPMPISPDGDGYCPPVVPGTDMVYKTPGSSSVNKNGNIKRPMNAFMIWARDSRMLLSNQYPNATNAEISVRLGQVWSQMNEKEKKPYFDEAERIKLQHRKDYPDWVYKPQPRKPKRSMHTLWHRFFPKPNSQSPGQPTWNVGASTSGQGHPRPRPILAKTEYAHVPMQYSFISSSAQLGDPGAMGASSHHVTPCLPTRGRPPSVSIRTPGLSTITSGTGAAQYMPGVTESPPATNTASSVSSDSQPEPAHSTDDESLENAQLVQPVQPAKLDEPKYDIDKAIKPDPSLDEDPTVSTQASGSQPSPPPSSKPTTARSTSSKAKASSSSNKGKASKKGNAKKSTSTTQASGQDSKAKGKSSGESSVKSPPSRTSPPDGAPDAYWRFPFGTHPLEEYYREQAMRANADGRPYWMGDVMDVDDDDEDDDDEDYEDFQLFGDGNVRDPSVYEDYIDPYDPFYFDYDYVRWAEPRFNMPKLEMRRWAGYMNDRAMQGNRHPADDPRSFQAFMDANMAAARGAGYWPRFSPYAPGIPRRQGFPAPTTNQQSSPPKTEESAQSSNQSGTGKKRRRQGNNTEGTASVQTRGGKGKRTPKGTKKPQANKDMKPSDENLPLKKRARKGD